MMLFISQSFGFFFFSVALVVIIMERIPMFCLFVCCFLFFPCQMQHGTSMPAGSSRVEKFHELVLSSDLTKGRESLPEEQ